MIQYDCYFVKFKTTSFVDQYQKQHDYVACYISLV